jgi:hypothetical protein
MTEEWLEIVRKFCHGFGLCSFCYLRWCMQDIPESTYFKVARALVDQGRNEMSVPAAPGMKIEDVNRLLGQAPYHAKYNRLGYKSKKRKYKKKKTFYKRRSPGAATFTSNGQLSQVIGRGGYATMPNMANMPNWQNYARMLPPGTFEKAGGLAGGFLGGEFGNAGLGSTLGSLGGKALASIAGFGSYTVSANSLMHRVDEGVQIPQFGSAGHCTIVRHREYVQDIANVAGSTGFQLLSFPLNPALPAVFPLLSGIASLFDQYQIIGMIWEFRTLSSDITAGGALGSVILATDYDTVDSNYANKVQMENSEYATSNKPSVDTVHCIECDPSLTSTPIKYTRSTGVPSGKDPRLYDHGNFQVAIVGLPSVAGTVLGELWVSYEIALYKPNILNSIAGPSDHFALPSTIAATNYLSSSSSSAVVNSPASGSTLGGTTSVSKYSFPTSVSSGKFYIAYSAYGANTTITTQFVIGSFVGCSAQASLNQAGTAISSFSCPSSGTLTQSAITCVQLITVTGAGASFSVTAGTLPGTLTGGDLFVIQLPVGFV